MLIKKNGIILVFAAAALMLLSLVAVGFVRLAVLEMNVGGNYAESTQAHMAAQSGIEYALVQLPLEAFQAAYSDPASDYQFKDSLDTGVAHSQAPSFLRGRHPLGFSYSLELQPGTLYATLKIIDANALFHINAPDSRHYRQMLQNLLCGVAGLPVAECDGVIAAIRNRRARYGDYAVPADLGHLVQENLLSAAQLETLSVYLTTHAWCDDKSIRYGSPDGRIEYDRRAPLNVNLAPKPLLMAALSGIRGRSPFAAVDTWIAERVATWVADELHERIHGSETKTRRCAAGCALCGKKGPFETWLDVEHFFLNELVSDPATQMTRDEAELIFANVYPDVRLNKKDPDRFHLRKFDKLDITAGTTDFCLFSPGIFLLTSAGRVVRAGEVRGLAVVSAYYRLWRPHFLTSQEEFDRDRVMMAVADDKMMFLNGFDMWTGPGPVTPNGLLYGMPQQAAGYLFAANPQSPAACTFWPSEATAAMESRCDGVVNGETGSVKTAPFQGGFSLWLKPGYAGGLEHGVPSMEIAEEHLPAIGGGVIVTRCAYQFELDAAGNISKSYITASRTYTADIDSPPRQYPVTVIYGAPVRPDAIQVLRETAKNLYDDLAAKMSGNMKNVDGDKPYIRLVAMSGEAEKLADNLAPFLYSALSTGDFLGSEREFYCYLKVQKNPVTHIDHNTGQPVFAGWQDAGQFPVQGRIAVNLDTTNAHYSGGGNQYDGTVPLRNFLQAPCPLKKCVFDGEPQTRQVTRDAEQPGGLRDVENAPYPPLHPFSYSRTEFRAEIVLQKGVWYHLDCRWGSGKEVMTIASLTVTSLQGIVSGRMAEDMIEGPAHVWVMKDKPNWGARYLAPGCVLYQSGAPTGGVPQRYRDVKMKIKPELSGLASGRPCKFATLAWSAFLPPKKSAAVQVKDGAGNAAVFSMNGKAAGVNSLFAQPVYDGAALHDFTIDIAFYDSVATVPNAFETPQLDYLVLYLLFNDPVLLSQSLDE